MSDDLRPAQVTDILGLAPTLAYEKGDVYVAGARKLNQKRRFGAWIFSTDKLLTGSLDDHCRYIAEHCLLANADPRPLEQLIEGGEIGLTVALYWFGGPATAFPLVSPDFETLVTARGGRLETVFDHDDEDEFRAA